MRTRGLVRVWCSLGFALATLPACGSPAASPTLTLLDPRHGHQVPVRCEVVDIDDCSTVASAMLHYFPADAAKVEGVRVEPLGDAPAGANIAFRVTMDHEMSLSAGEQAYRVVQESAGDELDIELILGS